MYQFKPHIFELPTRCDLCPRQLTGNGVKLKLDNRYEQNFHESCAEKVKVKLEKGMIYVQKLPTILMAISQDDGFVVHDMEEKGRYFTKETFEKYYRIFKKE